MGKKFAKIGYYKELFKKSSLHLLKIYKNLPIRRKLLFILYIQIIIPLILIGYMSYKNSAVIIENKSTGYSQDILKMIELRLKDYVNNLTVISQDLLYDKQIYSILNSDSLNHDPL
jgi:two-component system, sensor histidine kinase YesM